MTEFDSILPLIAAVACFGLSAAVLLFRARSFVRGSFAVGMIALGAESLFNWLTVRSTFLDEKLFWQQYRILADACVPAPWLMFSLTYSRGNYREFLGRLWPGLVAALAVPCILVLGMWDSLHALPSLTADESNGFLPMGLPGIVFNLIYLLATLLILMNLERTFNASFGTMRWRIKYMVLGLGTLFGVKIYLASQVLLYSGKHLSIIPLGSLGVLLGCGLISISFFRSRSASVDLYPSHAVLHRSLTVLLAGVYLLTVGLLAKLLTLSGGDSRFPLGAFFLLVGVVGLTVMLLSDRIRQRTKQFVSRHFRRSAYDYRKIWAAFTERTSAMVDQTEYCRAVARLIAETFEVLSVTIWLADYDKKKLRFAASTSLSNDGVSELVEPLSGLDELMHSIQMDPSPVDIDRAKEKCVETLRQSNPGYFPKGGNRVCLPLVSGGDVVGLSIVGDRVSGVPFSIEDFDLLKAIGDHAAAGLRNIQLSEQLLQARELEAFQTMSAFFVHDLKNTAATLSLMLENMATHFDDPAFRQDAVRGLGKSVNHLESVITELGFLRRSLEIRPVEADLNQVVESALACLGGATHLRLLRNLRPVPNLRIDPVQIRKVAINLLLNGRDAVASDGEIRIETDKRDGWVILSVSDNGCGMTQDFVRKSLFKPFHTTKKKGLGIGLFHCKMIVEAHKGRIDVETATGKGTTFQVLLPLANGTK